MSTELICSKSGRSCENMAFCGVVNEPLKGAVPKIRREVGGVSWRLAVHALGREIESKSNELAVDLQGQINNDGDALICPRDVLEGDLGKKLGLNVASQALANIAAICVSNVISDLQPRNRS